MGKVVTMLYSLLGIPIMFIYVATIGSILAKGFKYTYTKLCRWTSNHEVNESAVTLSKV